MDALAVLLLDPAVAAGAGLRDSDASLGQQLSPSPVIFFCVCGLWQSEQTAAFLLPAAIVLMWTPSSCFRNWSSWHCWHEV